MVDHRASERAMLCDTILENISPNLKDSRCLVFCLLACYLYLLTLL